MKLHNIIPANIAHHTVCFNSRALSLEFIQDILCTNDVGPSIPVFYAKPAFEVILWPHNTSNVSAVNISALQPKSFASCHFSIQIQRTAVTSQPDCILHCFDCSLLYYAGYSSYSCKCNTKYSPFMGHSNLTTKSFIITYKLAHPT